MTALQISDQHIDSLIHQHCRPLYASEQYRLAHGAETMNATVTFFFYRSHYYAVTCHHVLVAFQDEAHKTRRRIVPSIPLGSTISKLGHYTDYGTYRWSFKSSRRFPSALELQNIGERARLETWNHDKPDIAVAQVDLLFEILGNSKYLPLPINAINLDNWSEPNWGSSQPCLIAYGYPNLHKEIEGNKVAAKMPRISAALASAAPSVGKPSFILGSTLEAEHGWSFSGISGGPVLIAHNDSEQVDFVGLVYAGSPSLPLPDISDPESFTTGRDIILHCYYVTPVIFAEWLERSEHFVEYPLAIAIP